MKIYDSAVNATDLQVQSGCSALLIEVTKSASAGYALLFEFFNEQTSASADSLKLMLNDGALGQKTISSGLRALPLFLMSAVTPNSIQAIGKEMVVPAALLLFVMADITVRVVVSTLGVRLRIAGCLPSYVLFAVVPVMLCFVSVVISLRWPALRVLPLLAVWDIGCMIIIKKLENGFRRS
jgi:hypothetical protein